MPWILWEWWFVLQYRHSVPPPVSVMGVRGCLGWGGLSSHPPAVCSLIASDIFISGSFSPTPMELCRAATAESCQHQEVAWVLGTALVSPGGTMGTDPSLRWGSRTGSSLQQTLRDCDAARDPSARHPSVIVLFPRENKGSQPHTNEIKNVVLCVFFSPSPGFV